MLRATTESVFNLTSFVIKLYDTVITLSFVNLRLADAKQTSDSKVDDDENVDESRPDEKKPKPAKAKKKKRVLGPML